MPSHEKESMSPEAREQAMADVFSALRNRNVPEAKKVILNKGLTPEDRETAGVTMVMEWLRVSEVNEAQNVMKELGLPDAVRTTPEVQTAAHEGIHYALNFRPNRFFAAQGIVEKFGLPPDVLKSEEFREMMQMAVHDSLICGSIGSAMGVLQAGGIPSSFLQEPRAQACGVAGIIGARIRDFGHMAPKIQAALNIDMPIVDVVQEKYFTLESGVVANRDLVYERTAIYLATEGL